MRTLLSTALLAALPAFAFASDADTANRLVDASFNHGQVVQIAAHLTHSESTRHSF